MGSDTGQREPDEARALVMELRAGASRLRGWRPDDGSVAGYADGLEHAAQRIVDVTGMDDPAGEDDDGE